MDDRERQEIRDVADYLAQLRIAPVRARAERAERQLIKVADAIGTGEYNLSVVSRQLYNALMDVRAHAAALKSSARLESDSDMPALYRAVQASFEAALPEGSKHVGTLPDGGLLTSMTPEEQQRATLDIDPPAGDKG